MEPGQCMLLAKQAHVFNLKRRRLLKFVICIPTKVDKTIIQCT